MMFLKGQQKRYDRWQKLINCSTKNFWRGTVFRLPAKYPYEDIVDFMMVETDYDENLRLGLMVISGYKAGITFQIIPKEAFLSLDKFCISGKWFINNWKHWIYPECEVENVWVLPQGYPSPNLPNNDSIEYQTEHLNIKF